MAAVLEFRCDPDRASRRISSARESLPRPQGPGEVIIFPGVRVERQPEATAAQAAGPGPAADHDI